MKCLQIIVYLVGKLGITAAFGTVYLYTSELLPTSSRTAALGISSMCGRIGSMTSPYIGNLRYNYIRRTVLSYSLKLPCNSPLIMMKAKFESVRFWPCQNDSNGNPLSNKLGESIFWSVLSRYYQIAIFCRSLLPSLPLVIFGVSAFISGLLILMLPETLGKELPANIREALDLALPAPSERPFGPERLAVPIGMVTSFFTFSADTLLWNLYYASEQLAKIDFFIG